MGDLLSYLKVKGTSLPVSQTHSFAEQIANAMQYLEERRLVHRDLAARNVLVCTNDTVSIISLYLCECVRSKLCVRVHVYICICVYKCVCVFVCITFGTRLYKCVCVCYVF